MKKCFLGMVLLAAGLCSCGNDLDNEVYSCDEQLDEWAHANLRSIQSMGREGWLQLGEEYKIAAFNAMTPAQKVDFWKNKIQEVMTLDWTKKEKQHIHKLYIYLQNNPNMFEPEFLADSTKTADLRALVAQWEVDALFDYGFTEAQVYAILYTGNKMINKEGEYESNYTVRLRSDSEAPNESNKCNCNSEEKGCDATCTNRTGTGCGKWFYEPCDGRS